MLTMNPSVTAKRLTAGERSALRARAHALRPVVMVSGDELSASVLAEIGRCLERHELIKIRVSDPGRDRRDALLAQISAHTGASPVQHIGRILILYRERSAPAGAKAPAQQPVPRAVRAGANASKTAGEARPERPRRTTRRRNSTPPG